MAIYEAFADNPQGLFTDLGGGIFNGDYSFDGGVTWGSLSTSQGFPVNTGNTENFNYVSDNKWISGDIALGPYPFGGYGGWDWRASGSTSLDFIFDSTDFYTLVYNPSNISTPLIIEVSTDSGITWTDISGLIGTSTAYEFIQGNMVRISNGNGFYETITVPDTSGMAIPAFSINVPTASNALQIREAEPIINPDIAPSANVGIPYSFTPTSSISPVVWSLSSSTLPPGLTLNSATGEISGTPTTLSASSLDWQFNLQAYNGGTGSMFQGFTIYVYAAIAPPVILSDVLPDATVGVPYSVFLSATNNPTLWIIEDEPLPPGLTLNTSTGEISGIPTAPLFGYIFTTFAENSAGRSAGKTLSITINGSPPPTTITNMAPTLNKRKQRSGDTLVSVHAASSGNIVLSPAPATIDGQALVSGSRYVLFGQTDKIENGVWEYNGTDLVRPATLENLLLGQYIVTGSEVFVEKGLSFSSCFFAMAGTDNTELDGDEQRYAEIGTHEQVWVKSGGSITPLTLTPQNPAGGLVTGAQDGTNATFGFPAWLPVRALTAVVKNNDHQDEGAAPNDYTVDFVASTVTMNIVPQAPGVGGDEVEFKFMY